MESDIKEFSPPSSDDEDDGGLSSLSALAKQHQRTDDGKKMASQPPFRTFHPPVGVFGLKVGHGSVEGPGVARDESSSEECFSSLADLIASHLSTNNSSPGVSNKRLAFPPVSVTRPSASGSCSPSHEFDDVIIDLTCALKTNTIKHVQDDGVTSKHEEAPPVSLDSDEIEALSAANSERLSCVVSASQILQQTFPLREQEPSAFGKILCRKWRRLPLPKVLHRCKSVHTVKHFAFDSPSPDDAILKIRQRK